MSKKNSGLEFLEDPDALAGQFERAEDFFEQNRNIVLGVLGGIVLLVAGFFGYRYYISTQDDAAQVEMFPALFQLEADSTKKALNGDGKTAGLLSVASNYGSTPTGNLAELGSGEALMKQGKYDEAIEHLKAFSSSDLLFQGAAYKLIGDAYMEKKSFDEAIDYYKKAVDYKPNKEFTPGYLMKLAIAYEQAKQNDKAIEAYNEVIEKYGQSAESGNAKKYKSLLEATIGES
ncbi:tetratricopeptide repeat protein [Spirosoma harenae]